MKLETAFPIFICSILLSSSFFAIFSSLNFSPFVFAQEQEAESTTDPPADTSTTDPPADTSTTDPPADTSTTDPPADTQPVIIEEDHSTDEVFEKEITFSPTVSLDTEVVVSTEIPENLVEQGVEFQLYQVDGTTKTDVTFDDTVAAELVDTDGDNVADELQWQASQTSEQIFVVQGIIVTTAAEHLDSSRAFIENVYDKTNAQDGIWTDPIPVDDYIRVTFEKALSSSNDITIYARSSGSSVVEVYEKNSDVLIASFTDVSADKQYKIFLTNLQVPQDTFDLKIVGSPVEFDHIIDPPPPPNPSADLFQCANGGVGETPVNPCDWQNGNLNSNQAHIQEGQAVPYQIIISDLPTTGTHTFEIGFDVKRGGKFAIDYGASNDFIAETVDICAGVSGTCVPGTSGTIPAPAYTKSLSTPVGITPTTVANSFNSLSADKKL